MNKKQISITSEQYRDLITAVAIGNSVLGILGDVLKDGKEYKKQSNKIEELERHLLRYAEDFNAEEFTQDYDGEKILDDEFYEIRVLPIIKDYDDYTAQENLANDLAWRDFGRDHSKEELEQMAEKKHGYFGVALYEYEKKYWDEFEKNGFERLEVKK